MKDKFTVGVTPYDNYSIRGFAEEVKALHEKLNG
jgi:hypothetical protein